MADLVLRRDLLRRRYSEDDVRRTVRHQKLGVCVPAPTSSPTTRARAGDLGGAHRRRRGADDPVRDGVDGGRRGTARRRRRARGTAHGTALRDADGRHGVARARAVLAFADPRAESPGEPIADAVVRGKLREDALRAPPSVRQVVRWTSGDLDEFPAVAARLPGRGAEP